MLMSIEVQQGTGQLMHPNTHTEDNQDSNCSIPSQICFRLLQFILPFVELQNYVHEIQQYLLKRHFLFDKQEDLVMLKTGDTCELIGLIDTGSEEDIALRTLITGNFGNYKI